MRPRALGDEGGDVVTLPAGNDAALRGLASERRLRRGAGVAGTAGIFTLSALLLPPSLSWSERGAWTRGRPRDFGRPRAGVDVAAAVTASALGFARALPLPLPLLLLFGSSAPTPRAISAMPVSSVPSVPPSSLSPSPSSAGERARLARPLVLALAFAFAFAFAFASASAFASAFAFRSRARML